MTKEEQKVIYKCIKELSKAKGWKFNNHFIFKNENDFFYNCNLYMHPNDNSISVSLRFKPMVIDDLFWEITELEDNKKLPLSHRAKAAFQINGYRIVVSEILLSNIVNCENEITNLLKSIDDNVSKIVVSVTDIEQYLNYISKENNPDYNAIITCLIHMKDFTIAKEKISYCRLNEINSLYQFGEDDFYDMAEKYINKNEIKEKLPFNWKKLFSKN